MNIPGLTDVSDEAMKAMTLEELEDLHTLAMSKGREFAMQLEGLRSEQGVSRDHAAQFVGILPTTMALESFTKYSTTTNYAVATESLSTAVKVALVIGVVAAMGALVFYFTRAKERKVPEPSTKAVVHLEKLGKANEKLTAVLEGKVDLAAMATTENKSVEPPPSKRLKEAAAAGEVGKTRTALRAELENPGRNLNNLKKAVELADKQVPDLFVPYSTGMAKEDIALESSNELPVIDNSKGHWNQNVLDKHMAALRANFSRERFEYVMYMDEYLRESKGAFEEYMKEVNARIAKRKETNTEITEGQLDAYTYGVLKGLALGHLPLGRMIKVDVLGGRLDFSVKNGIDDVLIPLVDAAVKFEQDGLPPNLDRQRDYMKLFVKSATSSAGAKSAMEKVLGHAGMAAQIGSFSTPAEGMQMLLESSRKPAERVKQHDDMIYKYVNGSKLEIETPDLSKELRLLGSIFAMGSIIEAQEARLKALKKVPQEISEVLNEYIPYAKRQIQDIDLLSSFLALEIHAFNQCLRYCNVAVGDHVKGVVAAMEEVMNDQQVSQEMRTVIKSAIAQVRKGMTE